MRPNEPQFTAFDKRLMASRHIELAPILPIGEEEVIRVVGRNAHLCEVNERQLRALARVIKQRDMWYRRFKFSFGALLVSITCLWLTNLPAIARFLFGV